MKTTITIDEARTLLAKYIHQPHLLFHSRESEVIMRALARHFGEDEERWGMIGLLHDLDMEEIGENYEKHALRTCEILADNEYDLPEICQTIKTHTEALGFLGIPRQNRIDYCLAAAENVTGIITAYVLMRPDKKIAEVEVKSIKKKLKNKAFAANVNREMIYDIEKAGLELDVFLQIAIDAMKEIADELGM